ncbi:PLP-dependent transferase [Dissoconium aciculare CBS 342.82]|uniref:PLP-dependent transferase n=1 Tax=Dissoconium aciculare CBS 342.82 TaxID=1314786 RepID=A0A6J3MA70_9PEZI|nr:PLP-dependent transferase [Dissoconium aciculare CBS 342.82]KAF1824926.1 PLP-dependent transferase [Dissoconium aciculare CBS 342.82]
MMAERNLSLLEQALANALDKRRQQSTIRKLTINSPRSVDFSSNDFLSLASSPQLRTRFLQELHLEPALANIGSGGSRLLDGNSKYTERLEHDIASFHRAATGLLCNSGFDANVGLFSCLPQPGDVIVHDELIHASVHEGMRLSRATVQVSFAHNDIGSLRSVLESRINGDVLIQQGRRNVFVAVEAVYSMDGDIADLKAIVDIVRDLLPLGNGHIVVDEAHSTGIFGEKGRGLVCQLGLEDDITVRLHTFGKAMACNGAILLCNALIREYLINYARPMIYTTFMAYPAQAAVRASYSFLMEGKTVSLMRDLQVLIEALHVRLLEMQESLQLPQGQERLIQCPSRCPKTPIFAVLSSDPKALAEHCQRRGFVVRSIMPPTVPAGSERVRVCLHAGNTIDQIDRLVATMRSWAISRVGTMSTHIRRGARL